MTRITKLYMNHARMEKGARYRTTDRAPVFSWAAAASHKNAAQQAYLLKIYRGDELLFDSGWVETSKQEARYAGENLPFDRELTVTVRIRDDSGEESEPLSESFYVYDPGFAEPRWITADKAEPGRAIYFRKCFNIDGDVQNAVLYVCGIGYHKVFINGVEADSAVLDPLFSDYNKSCYYTVLPEVGGLLKKGENCIGVIVGNGWRNAMGVCSVDPNLDNVSFFGSLQLSASLRVYGADGGRRDIETDGTWSWCHGPITANDIFNGETYAAEQTVDGWNMPDGKIPARPVALTDPPGGTARINTVEPITENETLEPRSVTPLDESTFLVDFGVNIAGVCRLRLPGQMTAGQCITLAHAEMLDEDGALFGAPNRSARQTDRYIASGDAHDLEVWQPRFTYHGFRYVQVSGYPLLSKDDIRAVALYTDIKSDNSFVCGDPRVNATHNAVVRTEKNNIHGLFTDCPQRDERMGWMNDATVRFEETPYNFRIGRMFPKVIRDIIDTQGDDGSITCTAPHIFGCRPADPVCSSFLIAGLEALMHAGNTDIIRESYEKFAAWQACLAGHAPDDVVDYSYYGDWAGPEYACLMPEWPFSAVTPGEVISTGYYFFNARLLARFAQLLGKTDDVKRYEADAERIRTAMLNRFFNPETGQFATGSQACQCFALWLGVLPEDKRPLAAKLLHDDLVSRDFQITTGNLCTRYLFDVLTEYGYLEDAWTLITRDEYPSIGYMLQNEATTVWERFELKKTPGMNSHDHPMYGAVDYWFYAYLAGIRPSAPGWERVQIRPYFPEKLLSLSASVDTPRGDIAVRWVRRFGKLHLYVTVPFGVWADVGFDGRTETVGSGFWHFEREENR